MRFQRSVPLYQYRNYTRYRALLRRDFQYRCAYCLMHEYFLGGEAGCCIDHRRPVNGPNASPELLAVYSNLYWCCRECNENKGDTWPSAEQIAKGIGFLDPCEPEGDHSLHWQTLPNGDLAPLTLTGEYTIEQLKLWRPHLRHHRARIFQLQTNVRELEQLLNTRDLTATERSLVERRLEEILQWLEPPVFDRLR